MEPAALYSDLLLHALQPRPQWSSLPKASPHQIKVCHNIYLKKTNNENDNIVATNGIIDLSF